MIRRGIPADAESVATIQVSGWNAAYAGIMPDDYLASLTVEKRTPIWKEILTTGTTLIEEHNQQAVGFASIGRARDEGLKVAGYGEIYALYVDPANWRFGFGTELLRASLHWFRENDYRQVVLWVLEQNQIGRGFYEKLRFAHDGHSEPYQAGDTKLVELRYVRGL